MFISIVALLAAQNPVQDALLAGIALNNCLSTNVNLALMDRMPPERFNIQIMKYCSSQRTSFEKAQAANNADPSDTDIEVQDRFERAMAAYKRRFTGG